MFTGGGARVHRVQGLRVEDHCERGAGQNYFVCMSSLVPTNDELVAPVPENTVTSLRGLRSR